jgi:hypothetical protein
VLGDYTRPRRCGSWRPPTGTWPRRCAPRPKRLAASRLERLAAGYARADRLRNLQRTLAADYRRWQCLGERAALFDECLLGEAELNAEASLGAYQNGITEFTPLIRARLRQLDTRLQALRVRVDRAKAQAELPYLAADLRGIDA